ncbi:hypothetical protein ACFVWY_29755 [Streptomyces sp. NPDC058195]|uniref:hypothetical protein n=1 Tax=Streptomyces sp. NPDC058195 TaxID=3346375 RepID=UPI0036E52DC7
MTLPRDEHLAAAFGHAARTHGALAATSPGFHAHPRPPVRRPGVHAYALRGRRAAGTGWTPVCRGVHPVPAGTPVCRGVPHRAAGLPEDESRYRHPRGSVVGPDTAGRFAHRPGPAGSGRVHALPLPGWRTVLPPACVARGAHGCGKDA